MNTDFTEGIDHGVTEEDHDDPSREEIEIGFGNQRLVF